MGIICSAGRIRTARCRWAFSWPSCSASSAASGHGTEPESRFQGGPAMPYVRPLVLSDAPPYLGAMPELTDISLSPSAAARVAAIATRQGKSPILRLSVEGGGCAGFQYRFGLADEIEADDLAVDRDGVTLVVDQVSLDLVR